MVGVGERKEEEGRLMVMLSDDYNRWNSKRRKQKNKTYIRQQNGILSFSRICRFCTIRTVVAGYRGRQQEEERSCS